MTKEFNIKERVYFSIWEQWGELFAKRGYNWKNFSVIELSFEYKDHLYPKGSFEVTFQLIGFGLLIQYVSSKPTPEERKYIDEMVDQILGDEHWNDVESPITSSNKNDDDLPIGWC